MHDGTAQRSNIFANIYFLVSVVWLTALQLSKMFEDFLGTWKCIDSQNFGAYLAAIGAPPVLSERADATRPTVHFNRDGDKLSLKVEHGPPPLKDVLLSFKLGEEFDEHPTDGRKCKTLVTFEGDKLLYLQKWDGKETVVVREIRDGNVVATLSHEGVVALRVYKKVAGPTA